MIAHFVYVAMFQQHPKKSQYSNKSKYNQTIFFTYLYTFVSFSKVVGHHKDNVITEHEFEIQGHNKTQPVIMSNAFPSPLFIATY